MFTNEAARILGCSNKHIGWLIRNKKLRAKKVKVPVNGGGYAWQLDKKAVMAYLKQTQTVGFPRGRKRK